MADQPERQRWRAAVRATREERVGDLVQRAGQAGDDVAACQLWLAAQRLAQRYRREAGRRRDSPELRAHRGQLQALADDAAARVAGFEPTAVQRAQAGMGLRVAVVGKGGAGKSVIAGTLARLLARRGRSVLACDFDPNPGLAYSLGAAPEQGVLPADAVAADPGAPYGWTLRDDVAPADVIAGHTTPAPDGTAFVSLGKIDDVDKSAAKHTIGALQHVVCGFAEPDWDVVGDLEAGPTTPFEGYHTFADRVIAVVTPTWVSAMAARRLIATVGDIPVDVVANQWGAEQAHPDLPTPRAWLPRDPRVADAEHRGEAPLDACPDATLVAELDALADHLTGKEVAA